VTPERAAAIIEAREHYATALIAGAVACSRDLADGVDPVVAICTMVAEHQVALAAFVAATARLPSFHSGGIIDPPPTPVNLGSVRCRSVESVLMPGYSSGLDAARASGRDVSTGVVVIHPAEWRVERFAPRRADGWDVEDEP